MYPTQIVRNVVPALQRLVEVLPPPPPRTKLQLAFNGPLDIQDLERRGFRILSRHSEFGCGVRGYQQDELVQSDLSFASPTNVVIAARQPKVNDTAFRPWWSVEYTNGTDPRNGVSDPRLVILVHAQHLLCVHKPEPAGAKEPDLGLMGGWNKADRLRKEAIAHRRSFVGGILSALARFETPWSYGFVEFADASEIMSGYAYNSMLAYELRWHRMVEYHAWNDRAARERYPVRGVFWGNVLGKAILDRLGGLDEFGRRFDAASLMRPVWRGWRQTVGDHALFVSMSEDPADARYELDGRRQPPGGPTEMGAWLRSELRDMNLLI